MALSVLVLAGLLASPLSAEAARCGKERWSVKTGIDSDADLVDTAPHNVTRIAAMRSWPAPDHLPATKRIAPYELKVWVVDATLTSYKVEDDPNTGDSDYHLVNDETLATCTMIITEANSFIGAIHDRTPVLLDHEDTKAWLSGEAGTELLKPAPDDAVRMWLVSKRVSKPGNGDDPTLVEPISLHPAAEPATPFRLN